MLIAGVAYLIALRAPPGIFNLAVQYAFSGYSSLFPLLVAALFWKGSTKWGALAVTLWTTLAVAAVAVFQAVVPPPPPGSLETYLTGYMPVVPMTVISAILMIVVSWLTPGPSDTTINRYFQRPSAEH